MELDLLDKKILYELDLNARIPATQLAKKLRKSKETINFRINRLIQSNILKGFYTVFNTSKLGYYYIKCYIKFRNITPEKEFELIQYVKEQPRVAYFASCEGSYNIILLLMVQNNAEMMHFYDLFMKKYGLYIQITDMTYFLTTHRLNEKFLFKGTVQKDWFYPVSQENYLLDVIDKKLLHIISTQARLPVIDIAKKIGVDQKVITYRMKKLEKDTIIFSYVTAPDFELLGLVFFQINISLKDPTQRKSIIEFFNQTNYCLYAIESLGKYDLSIELHVMNNVELRKIMDLFRKQFVHIYSDYNILTITQEHTIIWGPFE